MDKYTQKTNRLLPVLLALAVFVLAGVPVFAGGNKAQSTSSSYLTLNVMQQLVDNQQVDFPNLWFYTELEKETGIHINWDVVRNSDWNTQVNLRMNSMDLPDLFRTGVVNVETYGVDQGLLVPLESYFRVYMPNYYSRLYMNEADKSMYASDGHLYYVGYLSAQNVNHIANHYINKTWLDQLGLAIPKTVDELTTVLRAFRDRAPNGNAATVLPMSAGGDVRAITDRNQGIGSHFAMFGVPFHENNGVGGYANVIPSTNKVQFVTDYPGFRAAVEWFAMAYSERLLDMESLTQQSGPFAVKVNAGNVGFFAYLRMLNSAITTEAGANYVSILPPASQYGVQVPRMMEVAVQNQGATLTIANKHVPETLAWLDKQLETERMMVGVNGPIHPGAPIAPTLRRLPDGKYDIISVPENNGLYQVVPVYHAMFFAPGDYIFPSFNMPPHRVERFETSKQYADAGVMEPGSYTILYDLIKPAGSDASDLERIYTDIDTLMQQSLADFIRSGVNNTNWNAFLSNLNNAGMPRYVQLLQKYYDIYAATLK